MNKVMPGRTIQSIIETGINAVQCMFCPFMSIGKPGIFAYFVIRYWVLLLKLLSLSAADGDKAVEKIIGLAVRSIQPDCGPAIAIEPLIGKQFSECHGIIIRSTFPAGP